MIEKLIYFFRRPKPKLNRDQIVETYGRVFTSVDGETVLDDMVRSFLLKACESEVEEGERRVVLRILNLVKEAEQIEPFNQEVNSGE